MIETPVYVGIPALSRQLGISPLTLYREIQEDKNFPCLQIRKRIVVNPGQVIEYLQKKKEAK